LIVKLKGKIDNYSENFLDIDVKDIVYRILMTNSNIEFFKEVTTEVEIFIYEIIKEDSRTFVGFKNFQEREVFSDLLTVQGVGSKMAINIMSSLECSEIIASIKADEISRLTKISGVGQKLAKRILNELKEKLPKKFELSDFKISEKDQKIKNDLISCLINLGYPTKISESTAIEVISKNESDDLESLIPIALKMLTHPS
jgi:Holliday junction DNA helicase RuvA